MTPAERMIAFRSQRMPNSNSRMPIVSCRRWRGTRSSSVPSGEGCLHRTQPVFDMAVDILQECDGILDAVPDRKPDKLTHSVTSAADTEIPRLKRHSPELRKENCLLSRPNIAVALTCLKC